MSRHHLATITTGVACIVVSVVGAIMDQPDSSREESATAREQSRPSLHVDRTAGLDDGGWTVDWTVQITCPRGKAITGWFLVAERDPQSVPELAGEDQGITARRDLDGTQRCTGRQQRLQVRLHVSDTTVTDPVTGTARTVHEPMHPTPSRRTSAAVQLHSTESPEEGGFFLQFCAAPNCAEETGDRITIR